MKTILYIDDERILLNLVDNALTGFYKVLKFEDPGPAITYFEFNHKEIDLIMIDFKLRGNDTGDEIADQLNQISKKPTIIVSGFDIKKRTKGHCDLFISKPYDQDYLLRNIKRVINCAGKR